MATMCQLLYSPLARHYHQLTTLNHQIPSNQTSKFLSIPFPYSSSSPSPSPTQYLSPRLHPKHANPNLLLKSQLILASAGGGHGSGVGGRSSGGGDGGGDSEEDSWGSVGPLGAFLNGWRSRVAADPEFPFKLAMEELVGLTACVLGDMASRPNFGLNELDFVFSTLVVGAILNFVLMYVLAPTNTISSSPHIFLPSIFANCPTSHMFEPGPYSFFNRFGTFLYKGTLFAAVGFAAGLVGTAISNGLMKMRKKMDPNFETPNKPPPTVLNAATWAIHMALSCNFRYQTVNGIEFFLAKGLPPLGFKTSVVVLRCLNNVLGGMSFVILARLTGSQSVGEEKMVVTLEEGSAAETKLVVDDNNLDLPSNKSTSN